MSAQKIIELRQLLQEKFPAAQAAQQTKTIAKLSSGIPAIDELGIPASGLSEFSIKHSGYSGSSGIGLILSSLLESQATPAMPLALVDYRSGCDVQSLGSLCERLLWIRCTTQQEALQCTDLLLHDGNLPLILLDFLHLTPRESRQIRSSCWQRLRQLSEQSGCALLTLNQHHLIPCAHFHCQIENRIKLDELHGPTAPLVQRLTSLSDKAQTRTG